MSASKKPRPEKDEELIASATKFLRAYAASAKTSDAKDIGRSGRSFSLGPGGIVELTDEVLQAGSDFVHRAAKLLKSKAAHEKAITSIAFDHALKFLAEDLPVKDAVGALVNSVFEQGNASFQYLAPNYLVRFASTVPEIRVGRVRALRTDDFSAEWKEHNPHGKVEIVAGDRFSIKYSSSNVVIEMRPICWVVSVSPAFKRR